jgi:hypothetical protein
VTGRNNQEWVLIQSGMFGDDLQVLKFSEFDCGSESGRFPIYPALDVYIVLWEVGKEKMVEEEACSCKDVYCLLASMVARCN